MIVYPKMIKMCGLVSSVTLTEAVTFKLMKIF